MAFAYQVHFLDGSTYDVSNNDINILKNESNFICDLLDEEVVDTHYSIDSPSYIVDKQIIKLDIQKTEFKIIIDYLRHGSRGSFSKHLSLYKKIKVLSASNYLMIDSIIENITDEIVDIIRGADSVDALREIFLCHTEEDKKWSLRLPSIKEEFKWCKIPVLSKDVNPPLGTSRMWRPSGKILKKLYSLPEPEDSTGAL